MTLGQRIERLLFLALFALAFAAMVLCCGCVDAATKAAISQVQGQAAIATAKAKAASETAMSAQQAFEKLREDAARFNPVAHPILNISLIVRDCQTAFKVVAVVSTVLCIAGWAVFFAAIIVSLLAALQKIGEMMGVVFGVMAGGSWLVLFSGGWAPEFFLATVLGVIAAVLIYLAKHKWDITQLWTAHTANQQKIQTVANAAGVPLSPVTLPSSPSITFTDPGSQGQPLAPY